jgi:uncharacterized protein
MTLRQTINLPGMADVDLYLRSQDPFFPDCAVIKPAGPRCNLNCAYCFYLPKKSLYPASDCVMSLATLESFIRQFLEFQNNEASIIFQGGEPLLRDIVFYEKAIEFLAKYNVRHVKITMSIQTNGTLITDDWAAFFKQNSILVGVSLDGPKELHDYYRKDPAGKGSFERVIGGIRLLQKHKVEFNILCAVHAGNVASPLETYRFFRDTIHAEYVQFTPIVNNNAEMNYQTGTAMRPESVQSGAYGLFLQTIFSEWVRRDVGKIFVQIFDATLANFMRMPGGLCTHAETCGRGIAVEHNGDVYQCDHFVEPPYLLGNLGAMDLFSMVNGEKQRRFGCFKKDALPKQCLLCDYYAVCHGECPKNRIVATPETGRPQSYLCEGLQLFFAHVQPAMEVMAQLLREKKPPALIMNLIRQESISDVSVEID